MTQPEMDCILFGFAGGMTAGAWCGYQVRKMFERAKAHRADHVWRGDKKAHKYDVVTGVKERTETVAQRISASRMRSPQLIPIARKFERVDADTFKAAPLVAGTPVVGHFASRPQTVERDDVTGALKVVPAEVDPTDHNVRGDVIDALVALGFKKVKVVVAVDACPLAQRTTAEAWAAAALMRVRS